MEPLQVSELETQLGGGGGGGGGGIGKGLHLRDRPTYLRKDSDFWQFFFRWESIRRAGAQLV